MIHQLREFTLKLELSLDLNLTERELFHRLVQAPNLVIARRDPVSNAAGVLNAGRVFYFCEHNPTEVTRQRHVSTSGAAGREGREGREGDEGDEGGEECPGEGGSLLNLKHWRIISRWQ